VSMKATADDATMKRVMVGRTRNDHRGGRHRSTTVILRCERERASKDERPVGGVGAVALRGPRFARAPQGDGHDGMRAARHDAARCDAA